MTEKDDKAKQAEEKKIEEQLLGSRDVTGRTEENKPPEQAEIDNAQRVLQNGPEASLPPQSAEGAKETKARRKKAEKGEESGKDPAQEPGGRNESAPAQMDDGDGNWGGLPVQMRNND